MARSRDDTVTSLMVLPIPKGRDLEACEWCATAEIEGQGTVTARGATPDLALAHLADKLNCRVTQLRNGGRW
ncbi:MAG TPA: hypothetical protein VNK95_05225 [Caldilineaceae bacterium]|nr:hypothetical protein [Caldilineaceae bacterium]